MSTWIKGEQIGAIAKDGKTLFELHDYFCTKHKQATTMKQFIVEEVVKEGILIIMGKSCGRCHNTVMEGEYVK